MVRFAESPSRWEVGKHRRPILGWISRFPILPRRKQQLLLVALELEEGQRPWIQQYGFATFERPDSDHRLIETLTSTGDENEDPDLPSQGPAPAPSREATWSAPGRAPAEAEEAEARSSIRGARPRLYGSVAEVIREDSAPIALYFPQFSVVEWDPDLDLWFREGWIQPLTWWPVRHAVRLCYEDADPTALPIVRISPPPRPRTPHVLMVRRGRLRFPALCYTFAPDRTIVRGRREDDDGAEVLRQVVMWLLRYHVWTEFGFWPGQDVAHDPVTIERLTRPDDPCPFHSWRRYGACCRRRVLQQGRRLEKRVH